MAEEIISSWVSDAELAAELIAKSPGDRKTQLRVYEITQPLEMHFRFQDGNGTRVVWPLTLISDTTLTV